MIQPDCRRDLQILACKMAFSPVLASGRKWTIWINWLSESKDVLNRVLHQYIQCHKTPPFHNLSWSQRLLWALGVHACSWLPDYSRYIYMHSLLTTWYCLPYRTTFYNGTDVSMWIFFHNLYRFEYKVTCWFSYIFNQTEVQSSTLWDFCTW